MVESGPRTNQSDVADDRVQDSEADPEKIEEGVHRLGSREHIRSAFLFNQTCLISKLL